MRERNLLRTYRNLLKLVELPELLGGCVAL